MEKVKKKFEVLSLKTSMLIYTQQLQNPFLRLKALESVA